MITDIQNSHFPLTPLWEELSGSLILETFRDNELFTSSCVAIDEYTLLTAAHSAIDVDYAFVHLGLGYDQKYGERLKVSKFFIHPDYDQKKSNYLNDLAIIKLTSPLPFFVKTYSIAKLNSFEVERIGFGGRKGTNNRTWTHSKVLFEEKRFLKLKDENSTIGDSGGPLFNRIIGEYQLVGIHSTLEGTDTTYAVNLSHYEDWIVSMSSALYLLEA
jgi:secreted trypsin-like serine protease